MSRNYPSNSNSPYDDRRDHSYRNNNNSYRDGHNHHSYHPRHSNGSTYSPSTRSTNQARDDYQQHIGARTPPMRSASHDGYEHPSHGVGRYRNGDHRGSVDGYRGGGFRGGAYRGGNYRGGYRGGRYGLYSSPYSRGGESTSHFQPRGGSYGVLSSRDRSPYPSRREPSPSTANHTSTSPVDRKKQYTAPWVKLLGLENLRMSDEKLELEYASLREEKEELHMRSCANQEKLKELKTSLMKADWEVDALKVAVARDQLHVDQTQENLDAITLL